MFWIKTSTCLSLWLLTFGVEMIKGAEFAPMKYLAKNSMVVCKGFNCYQLPVKSTSTAPTNSARKFLDQNKEADLTANGGNVKRPSSYVRFGKRRLVNTYAVNLLNDDPQEKRTSSYVRFGKRDLNDYDVSNFVNQAQEKRPSSYVRFGKRDSFDYGVYGDQLSSDKRPSSYVRFGKRPSSYVRFGKRSEEDYV